ncbi:hypothetical protein HYS31_04135 [Candidatus Woesearchaeota archaeon]|nr:hypothetical protein [Candidatus Woesearchaeota archaeon]
MTTAVPSLDEVAHFHIETPSDITSLMERVHNAGTALVHSHIQEIGRNLFPNTGASNLAAIIGSKNIILDPSKRTVSLTDSLDYSGEHSGSYVFDEQQAAKDFYFIRCINEISSLLKANNFPVDVEFNELLRNFSVLSYGSQKIFVAAYSGQQSSDPKLYVVTGKNNNKAEWRVIELPEHLILPQVKDQIGKLGYDAVMQGNIGLNKYELLIRPL